MLVNAKRGRHHERQSLFQTPDKFKNAFSTFVFTTSVVGIFVLIYSTVGSGDKYLAPLEVFTALLPVFATWVGTILAFYYTKENLETAVKAVNSAQDFNRQHAAPQTARQISDIIKLRGDPRPKIVFSAERTSKSITVKDLKDAIAGTKDATRVLICDQGDIAKYIIYGSTISRTPNIADTMSLDDFLKETTSGSSVDQISKKFTFLSPEKTVADAKAAMKNPGIRDILITKSGLETDKVEGWITDTEITKI